jgi:hypothetical protein
LVRHTLDALTARLVAISSSFTPASAASRIYDYVYRRQGTLNLFIVMDVSRPWRRIKVTERRTAQDYAVCVRELVDVAFPSRPEDPTYVFPAS